MKIFLFILLILFTFAYLTIVSIIDIKTQQIYCIGNYIYFFISSIFIFLIHKCNIKQIIYLYIFAFITWAILSLLFFIFRIGQGDAELLFALTPVIMLISDFHLIYAIYLILCILFFASLFALITKIFFIIKTRKFEDKSFAFAPYISVSLLFLIISAFF